MNMLLRNNLKVVVTGQGEPGVSERAGMIEGSFMYQAKATGW